MPHPRIEVGRRGPTVHARWPPGPCSFHPSASSTRQSLQIRVVGDYRYGARASARARATVSTGVSTRTGRRIADWGRRSISPHACVPGHALPNRRRKWCSRLPLSDHGVRVVSQPVRDDLGRVIEEHLRRHRRQAPSLPSNRLARNTSRIDSRDARSVSRALPSSRAAMSRAASRWAVQGGGGVGLVEQIALPSRQAAPRLGTHQEGTKGRHMARRCANTCCCGLRPRGSCRPTPLLQCVDEVRSLRHGPGPSMTRSGDRPGQR